MATGRSLEDVMAHAYELPLWEHFFKRNPHLIPGQMAHVQSIQLSRIGLMSESFFGGKPEPSDYFWWLPEQSKALPKEEVEPVRDVLAELEAGKGAK